MLKTQILAKTTLYTIRSQYETFDTLSEPEVFFQDHLYNKTLQLAGLSNDMSIESLALASTAVLNDKTIYNFIVTVSM